MEFWQMDVLAFVNIPAVVTCLVPQNHHPLPLSFLRACGNLKLGQFECQPGVPPDPHNC